jgi:hypothetical protein
MEQLALPVQLLIRIAISVTTKANAPNVSMDTMLTQQPIHATSNLHAPLPTVIFAAQLMEASASLASNTLFSPAIPLPVQLLHLVLMVKFLMELPVHAQADNMILDLPALIVPTAAFRASVQ